MGECLSRTQSGETESAQVIPSSFRLNNLAFGWGTLAPGRGIKKGGTIRDMLGACWEEIGERVERATKDDGEMVGKQWGGFLKSTELNLLSYYFSGASLL